MSAITSQWQVFLFVGVLLCLSAVVRSGANVTYSMMCSSCGDALEWCPPFLQQRLQLSLCNSSGQEEDDMALACMGNSVWVRSMALTLHKVVTYR